MLYLESIGQVINFKHWPFLHLNGDLHNTSFLFEFCTLSTLLEDIQIYTLCLLQLSLAVLAEISVCSWKYCINCKTQTMIS